MSIEFDCSQCSKTLRVATSNAGKKCKCPSCHALLTIPNSSPSIVTSKTSHSARVGQTANSSSDNDLDDDSLEVKIEIACPKCSNTLLYSPELEGTRGLCKGCGHIFTLSHGENAIEEESETFPFQCPNCEFLFEGKPEMEGRKGKCTECQSVFVIEKLKTEKPVAAPVKKPLQPVAKPSVKPAPPAAIPVAIPTAIPAKPAKARPAAIPTAIPTAIPVAVPHNTASQNFTQPSNTSAWDAIDLNQAAAPFQSPTQQNSAYSMNPYSAGSYASNSTNSRKRISSGTNDVISIASWHRKLCISVLGILLTIPFYVGSLVTVLATIDRQQPQIGPIHMILFGCMGVSALVMLVFGILLLISYIVLCTKLYDSGMAIVMILGYFIGGVVPFLPLIMLVVVASKGSSVLKSRGYAVGLLGVPPDQLR
jgi:DNA-directed RNA polymerase subunit RPC12/RpoP